MKLLKTIRDKDFGFENTNPVKYKERQAARAVVFDNENNVALLHARKENYHKLPGGGIEEGEDVLQALRREVLEEIGCNIEEITDLGIIEEYRDEDLLHQISHCFIAKLNGEKGIPKLTESEILEDFNPIWLPLEEAIKIINNKKIQTFRRAQFMVTRDLTFLKEAESIIKFKK